MTENTTISYTDYLGERIDRDRAEVDYLLHDLGRVVAADAGKWIYEYHLTDHLGNVRVAFADLDEDGDAEMLQENHYYPFGQRLNLPGYQSSDANPYLYNGKELQEDLGLRWYDYGARFYDAQLIRTTTQDPLAEKFYSLSSYGMFANNPLRFIDPTGMEIEEGSKKEWEMHKGNVEKQRNKLQRKASRLANRAQKKGWSDEKLAKRQGDLGEKISSLNSTLGTLSVLESSSQIYRLSKAEVGKDSGTTLDTENNVIDLSIKSTASFVHEATHAGQFESRDLAFDLENGNTLAHDVNDEVAAYKAQYAYSPRSFSLISSTYSIKSINKISPTWVQGIEDGKVYVPGGIANTGLHSLNINSSKADLIRAYPNNHKLKGLPENYSLKQYENIYYKK